MSDLGTDHRIMNPRFSVPQPYQQISLPIHRKPVPIRKQVPKPCLEPQSLAAHSTPDFMYPNEPAPSTGSSGTMENQQQYPEPAMRGRNFSDILEWDRAFDIDHQFDPKFEIENQVRKHSFAEAEPEHMIRRPLSYAETESEYYSHGDVFTDADSDKASSEDLYDASPIDHDYADMDAAFALEHAYQQKDIRGHEEVDDFENMVPERHLDRLDKQDKPSRRLTFAALLRHIRPAETAADDSDSTSYLGTSDDSDDWEGSVDQDAPISAADRKVHIRQARADLEGRARRQSSILGRLRAGIDAVLFARSRRAVQSQDYGRFELAKITAKLLTKKYQRKNEIEHLFNADHLVSDVAYEFVSLARMLTDDPVLRPMAAEQLLTKLVKKWMKRHGLKLQLDIKKFVNKVGGEFFRYGFFQACDS